MDWWEHVRRCRRRAQARPAMSLQLAKAFTMQLHSIHVHCIIQYKVQHWQSIRLHGFCTDTASSWNLELRCHPFQFQPCYFRHPYATRCRMCLMSLSIHTVFENCFWFSFKRVFLREKKRKSRVAAESLGGVQARLESSITKVGRTWSHWHKGLSWFINMFIQCLSWFITRYCYHGLSHWHIWSCDQLEMPLVKVKAVLRRRGISAKQLFALQVRGAEQALKIAHRLIYSTLPAFHCFSMFFHISTRAPLSLCHDSMSQAQKENVRNKQKQ